MALQFDPELIAAMGPMVEAMAAKPQFPVGDVASRRQMAADMFKGMSAMFPAVSEVTRKDHTIKAPDGADLVLAELRSTKAPESSDSKAVYFIHGGGMIMGSIDLFAEFVKGRVLQTGVPAFMIGYRLAPEHKHPIPVNDCYAGLQWLSKNAASLGIDPARIILMGESAGGGLAAATALMARDNKLSPALCKQILIFPMLDDRTNKPMPELEEFSKAVWSVRDNQTGWEALIGEKAGSSDPKAVSEYAAPARAESVAGLPPTYIECGQLDIFVYEDMKFATRLAEASVPIELHIYPGQPHGFQMFGSKATYGAMSTSNVLNAIKNA